MPWAIVTAASRGIGYIISRGLARRGYNLVIGSRSRRSINEAARKLKSFGVEVYGIQLDLRRRDSLDRFLEESGKIIGNNLRVAVINYGNPSCEPCSLFDAKWEDWIEAAQMYLASTARLLSWLKERVPVRTIIISSFTTHESHPPLAVSDIVRSGLETMVRLAAREEPRLMPILVLLGSFRTPGATTMIQKLASKSGVRFEDYWREKVEGLSPLGRTGREEELEEFIGMLVRMPEYLTGATILFDGATARCIH